ncbi:MAG: transglutaminase family protein [Cyanobacteria bacterium J06621_3]
MSSSTRVSSALRLSTIRPIGVYMLCGLATHQQQLLAIDTLRGYLVRVSVETDATTILNPHTCEDWVGASGLAVWGTTIWLVRGHRVFYCDAAALFAGDRSTTQPGSQQLNLQAFAALDYDADGVAVWEERVYVTSKRAGYIHVYDRASGELLDKLPQPGIGQESIVATADALWVCDQAEQTVYRLSKTTGDIQLSALTPFKSPTGITFLPVEEGDPICYVSYAYEEPYIRDDPNAESPYQLTFRDRTFIHPLNFYQPSNQPYTLSNGYLIEISYVEELQPLEAVQLNNVQWRIALPSDTLRQKVRHVEPIGHPFTEEEQNGQRVAVFNIDSLSSNQAGLIGWKATVEMYGLKHFLTPENVEDAPPLSDEFQAKYLIDDDELAMDTETIRKAATEAAGTESNVLRKMLKIRNHVYDQLSYGIQPKIDTPDIAWERGIASCGEYVGVLLALARLNGIACRTIGRYKCPATPEQKNLPLEPDFNHVWLEFYVPGVGWLPMESNVDDVVERGPYPTRFFMGLSWYHTEIGKGISFEKMKADNKPEDLSLGDLAINHVRFTILEELNPNPS